MANGNNPGGPRRPSVRPGPIQTFLPQRLQTPGGILDQDAVGIGQNPVGGIRNQAGAAARGVTENGDVLYELESMEKDALMLGRHIPENARFGLDRRIIIRVQELKRRAYFNRKELASVGRLPIAPFARRKISAASEGTMEERMFIERINLDKASGIGHKIQEGLKNAGLRFIFEVKPYGLALTPDFLAVCNEAASMRGHDLNKDMGSLVMRVNDAIVAAGVGVTDLSFRYLLEKLLDKAVNMDSIVCDEIDEGKKEEEQQQQFQRYLFSIPQGGSFGSDAKRDSLMLEEVLDLINDMVGDANLGLSYLGLRQMAYTGLQKSLTGRDMLIGVAGAKKYLFERYLIEYMKWLLGNSGRE